MASTLSPLPAAETWKERARHAWILTKGHGKLLGPSARFLTTCEAHTYAYSVAANAILALVPFLVLLLTVADLTRSQPARAMIFKLVGEYLPAGADRLSEDLRLLTGHHGVQIFSFIMLAISSSGVFLPFEVALNGIWGFKKNRSYLGNQIISLLLVAACAALAYAGVVLAAMFNAVLVDPIQIHFINAVLSRIVMFVFAFPLTIVSFWIVFWWLPNGKVPPMQVFPAAFYTGILAEVFKIVFALILPLLDFQNVYGRTFWLPVTLLVWTYAGAVLLLFGASLSARGVIKLPQVRFLFHAAVPNEAAAAAGGTQEV